MSDRLAIASAFSVFMMAAYALLGQDAVRVPLAGETASSPFEISAAVDLPGPSDLVALLR